MLNRNGQLAKKMEQALNLLRFCAGNSKAKTGPLKVCWYITDRCNAKCKACEIWKRPGSENSEWLTTERAKEIIKELADNNVLHVLFVGGEPLLRRDIFQLIDYAKALDIKTSLTSNCLILNEDRAKKICDSGLDRIYLSLDSLSSSLHDELRGIDGCFKKVMSAIELLKKHKTGNKPDILLSYVMSKKTINEFLPIVKFAYENGLAGLTLQIIHTVKRNDLYPTDDLLFDNDDLELVEARIMEVLQSGYLPLLVESKEYYEKVGAYLRDPEECYKYRCLAGYAKAHIEANGDIFPCERARDLPLGNIQSSSFSEVWFSAQAEAVRNRIRFNDHPACWLTAMWPQNLFLHNVHPMRFHKHLNKTMAKKIFSIIK